MDIAPALCDTFNRKQTRRMEFRTYCDSLAVAADYRKLHEFLVQTGNREYTYARFDWMMTNRDYLEGQYVKRIGFWEDEL